MSSMVDLTNDGGPLFGRVFTYNINTIVPIAFNWPSNDNDNSQNYFLLNDDAGGGGGGDKTHHDRIKIKSSLSSEDFFKALKQYTPSVVFVMSQLTIGDQENEFRYDKLTTLIYGGSDLRLDYISHWFPNLKFLYVYSLRKLRQITVEQIHFPELETFSCWFADLDVVDLIDAPKLQNLDIYKRIGIRKQIQLKPLLRLRTEDVGDILLDDGNLQMEVLQYFHTAKGCALTSNISSEHELTTEEKRDRFMKYIRMYRPRDVLVPSSLLSAADISELYDLLESRHGKNFTLGAYIDDAQIEQFIQVFKSLQIFDNFQPLKTVSLRESSDSHVYLTKDMDSGIREKILPHDRDNYKFLLGNFNIFTDTNQLWLNVFNDRLSKYIYICSSELLLDNERKWPNLVKNNKNRVVIYNAETKSVYLDINRKPIFMIADILKRIYQVVQFANVYIAIRTDETNANHKFEESLHNELGMEKQLNIFKYDLPAKILTY